MVSKVTKKINLKKIDLYNELKDDQKKEATQDVASFLKSAILNDVGGARSPVTGDQFKSLSAKYKKIKSKKSSSVIANLELTGDMLDALDYQINKDTIEIGIFDESQAPKADGHCNHSGKSKLPNRRFIPKGRQKFRKEIEDKVRSIIREYHED